MSVVWSIVPALWVGSLWTVGYLVVPVLFATLEDRTLAGDLAARLFAIESWLSIACAGLLLLSEGFAGARTAARNTRMPVVIVMVALIGIGQWLVGPTLASLRAAGQADSVEFAVGHGAAAVLYLAASVLGLYLLVSERRRSAE